MVRFRYAAFAAEARSFVGSGAALGAGFGVDAGVVSHGGHLGFEFFGGAV